MIRGLLKGQSVEVIHMDEGALDELGSPTVTERRETVQNVLVCPGPTVDAVESMRPDGVTVAYTLAFPKPYAADLRGAEVEIRGERFRVIGDPQPCELNCPTAWWMRVEVERADG